MAQDFAISGPEMRDILDGFAKRKDYERIEYRTWKYLYKTPNYFNVDFYSAEESYCDCPYFIIDGIYEFLYSPNKKDFGYYLYEYFFNKEEENENMKFNFDFGPVGSDVHMSMYGMAIKNASGTYVAYDANTKQIMDVDIFNFEGANKFMYKMPVAIKDIKAGDVIVHQRVPMYVIDLPKDDGVVVAIDPYHGERKEIMCAHSPFGFNYVTKVVNLFGDNFMTPDSDNPFGNMWLMLCMENNTNKDMLPLMLMSMSLGNNGVNINNPAMLMAMYAMNESNSNNFLPLLLMMQQNNK